jgi:predicted nucleic acid-binding protein
LPKEKHYFDSCILIGFANKEPEKFTECKNIIQAGEEGIIEVYTSAFTTAELAKIKNFSYSNEEMEEIIQQIFNWSWLNLVAFERETGKISRHLTREYGLKPFDALHLATAIRQRVNYFDTTDINDYKKKSIPDAVGYPPDYGSVIIQRPVVQGYTPSLF